MMSTATTDHVLYRALFIDNTLHMMSVRIAPDDPIRAPTTVSNGLSIMNPSAHSAHPEYELSTVITWGHQNRRMVHPAVRDSAEKYTHQSVTRERNDKGGRGKELFHEKGTLDIS